MTPRERDRLERKARYWQLSSFEQPFVAAGYRLPEALLHEVSHALALGQKVDRRTSERVGDMFDLLNERHPALGLVEEAFTVAVEADAIRRLGWSRAIRVRRLLRDVWEKGTAGPALPWECVEALYRRLRRSDRVRELGEQAADIISTWAAEKSGRVATPRRPTR